MIRWSARAGGSSRSPAGLSGDSGRHALFRRRSAARRNRRLFGLGARGFARAACALGVVVVAARGAPIPVFVTIDPQAYLVRRIGGEHVAVSVLVGPGQCAETFEPTPKQMTELGDAKLYFTLGVPMERTIVPRIEHNFPDVLVVSTLAGIAPRRLDGDVLPEAREGAVDSSKAGRAADPALSRSGAGAEGAGGPDPHVWLNPHLARTMSRTIYLALSQADPPDAADYRRNLAGLEPDLDSLYADVARTLAPVKGRTMIVYHPYYGYLADAFGFRQISIEVGGFPAGSRYLAGIADLARREGTRALFVQRGEPEASAEAVAAEIGGKVIVLDPMSGDYLNNLREMARRIRAGLAP